MAVVDEVIEHIRTKLVREKNTVIDHSSSLFEAQVLDSLNMIELINFIEKHFEIKVAPSEVTLDNLDTPGKIAKFITSKKG